MSSSNEFLTLIYPGFTINLPTAAGADSFILNGKSIHLQPTDLRFFRALAERPGQVLSEQQLLGAVYGAESASKTLAIVSVHVSKLRKVLNGEEILPKDLIQTYSTRGYELMQPITHTQDPLSSRILYTFTRGAAVLTIDSRSIARVNGEEVRLTPREFDVLALLMSTPGKAWSKERLMQALYGTHSSEPEYKILDVFICKLRKKLAAAHEDLFRVIISAWGRGPVLQDSPLLANPPTDERGTVHDPVFGRLPVANLHSKQARWVPSRKKLAVKLVRSGELTVEQLLEHYPDLQREDFESWIHAKDLRVTRYKRAA